jgi:hypothetical protein
MKPLLRPLLLAAALTLPVHADPINDVCQQIGALTKNATIAKAKGVPESQLQQVAAKVSGGTESVRLWVKTIIHEVYTNDSLHPDDAEMIGYIACRRAFTRE